jgi:hypothetical protein
MIGRLPVFVMLAGMVWAWDNQVAFASQEPRHCSVVGDLEVRPFTSRVFHNTRKLRVWLPPGYKNRDQRSERYGDAVTLYARRILGNIDGEPLEILTATFGSTAH